jgi:hypothetical protein
MHSTAIAKPSQCGLASIIPRSIQRFLLPATFDQVGCLPCQKVEPVKILFGGLMGCAPMGGDHPNNVSGAGDQGRRLAGVNPGLKIDMLIFGIGHKVTDSYVWRDHPPCFAQRYSASTF